MTREEAVKILKEERWYMSRYSEEYKVAYDMAIKALSAEAVQGWIPCSERLPSEEGWYVVTVCGYERIVDVLLFDGAEWNAIKTKQEVVAWMPLPEPYKGGEGE